MRIYATTPLPGAQGALAVPESERAVRNYLPAIPFPGYILAIVAVEVLDDGCELRPAVRDSVGAEGHILTILERRG